MTLGKLSEIVNNSPAVVVGLILTVGAGCAAAGVAWGMLYSDVKHLEKQVDALEIPPGWFQDEVDEFKEEMATWRSEVTKIVSTHLEEHE